MVNLKYVMHLGEQKDENDKYDKQHSSHSIPINHTVTHALTKC